MNELQMARDLRTAADYLRTHGWNGRVDLGGMGEDGSPRCAAGAIYSAIGADFFRDPQCSIGKHLAALGFVSHAVWEPGLSTTIAAWNDQPGRTLPEVLDRLESTALALEIRHLSHEPQTALEEIVTPELVTA